MEWLFKIAESWLLVVIALFVFIAYTSLFGVFILFVYSLPIALFFKVVLYISIVLTFVACVLKIYEREFHH